MLSLIEAPKWKKMGERETESKRFSLLGKNEGREGGKEA